MALNVIKASAEVLSVSSPLERIEYAARVCYNSVDRMAEGTAEPLIRRLLKAGHLTPLEAAGIITPDGTRMNARRLYETACRHAGQDTETAAYALFSRLAECTPDPDYTTYRLVCSRAIGNQLVRHRALMFADSPLQAFQDLECPPPEMSMNQESMRYVNFGKVPFAVVLPEPAGWAYEPESEKYRRWSTACERAYGAYCGMLEAGMPPQEARGVLPLSSATVIVMSGTSRQWDAFFRLREAAGADPQVQHLCRLMRQACADESESTND